MSRRTRGRRQSAENLNVCASAVDRYVVADAVLKDDTIVGHLPKTSARIYLLFLRRGGVIQCHIAGKKISPDKIPPPQVLGKIAEIFPPAKVARYGTWIDNFLHEELDNKQSLPSLGYCMITTTKGNVAIIIIHVLP